MSLILLIKYSLINAFKFRKELFQIIEQTDHNLQLIHVDPNVLVKKGITKTQTLILDFDGVMAAHGKERPDRTVIKWLKEAIECFGQKNIFILSNALTKERKTYFLNNYPEIHLIDATRKKPYPDGVLQILKISKSNPDEAIIIDDRILTGILAGHIAGIKTIYIRNPFSDISGNPGDELFFAILRKLEKYLIRIMVKINV